MVGIGPDRINNEKNFQRKCWSFICGNSKLNLAGEEKNYNHYGKLKEGDIIEEIIDRKLGNLYFSINNISYGIATNKIPIEEKLYPTINMFDENQSIEILN